MNQDTSALIAQLFLTIAHEEQKIELSRSNLALNSEFDPVQVFQHLDVQENGLLTADEFAHFLKQNYIRINAQEASLIVKEYDANQDDNLDFEEFTRLFLPSTNQVLKEIAINRSSHNARLNQNNNNEQSQLSNKLLSQISEHIQLELRFTKIKNEIKRQLLQKADFTKTNYFNYIANNKDKITVADLVTYLRQFGKHNPRNEELEAILRRCDHEGDQMISYEEFCELVSSNDQGITTDEVDEKNYESNTKKELSKDISNSPIRKSPSKNDLYEKSIEETMKEYESPDNKEAQQKNNNKLNNNNNINRALKYEEEKENQDNEKQEEQQEQNNNEKPLEFRFLSLLKNQIKLDKEVEIQKEILFSNLSYNSYDAFKIFDKDNKGFISTEDLQQAFENLNINASIERFINRYDKDHDGLLNFNEFQKAITPKNRSYLSSINNNSGHYLKKAGNAIFIENEWKDDLKEVLLTASRAEEILVEIRDTLAIDGEAVYNLIDNLKLGYITIRTFGSWLKNNVGFNLNDLEADLVLSRYDKDSDFKIKQQEFIDEVNLVNDIDQEQVLEELGSNNEENNQQNYDQEEYEDDFE